MRTATLQQPDSPRSSIVRRTSDVGPQTELKPLLVAMVAQAVCALQDWSKGCPEFHTKGRDCQVRRLKEAQAADAWLLQEVERPGPDDEGLTFREVSEALGMDSERFIERLYATLDHSAIEALWMQEPFQDRRRAPSPAVLRPPSQAPVDALASALPA